MKSLTDIYRLLFDAYGPQHWWPAETVFEMMAGAILTQNTAWGNVSRSIDNLGADLTPEYMLSCPTDELASRIRPSGYYNQKAVRLKVLADWYRQYGFDTERVKAQPPETTRHELLTLNGVGCETADSILLYAFNKPYFVIDTYTKHIFSRLGYDLPEGYEPIRQYFEERLPRQVELYNEYHALIVKHAKEHCKSKPICKGCPLCAVCPSYTMT